MKNLKIYTRNVLIVIFLSLLSIVVFGLSFKWCNSIKIISLGFLLAVSSFSVGSTLGFIFGLPTYKNDVEVSYERNTSLKEIADWITKIIVGITLVELKSIVLYFQSLVVDISKYLGIGDSGIIFSSTILIEFFFIGFVCVYLLTITDVFKYLANNDKVIKDILVGSTGEKTGDLKVTDLIDEDIKLTEDQKSKILSYVKDNIPKIEDLYVIKRLAKIMFSMKEYLYSAKFYAKAYELDDKNVFSKLNEAYIRSKFLKEASKANSILEEIIKNNENMAIPYYNLACNYNREYSEIYSSEDVNEEYVKGLKNKIENNLTKAFDIDEGLLSEAISDSELKGINVNEIFNKVYSNNK